MAYNDWSISYKKALQAFPRLPFSLNYLVGATGILGFLGFSDATYLTVEHYKNVIPSCSFAHGCETVLTSQYSALFGIPIALIGAAFYLALMALLLIWIQTKQKVWMTLLTTTAGAGLFVAVILVGIQAFVLHAFCQYCLGSELIDFLLFDCVWWMWRKSQ